MSAVIHYMGRLVTLSKNQYRLLSLKLLCCLCTATVTKTETIKTDNCERGYLQWTISYHLPHCARYKLKVQVYHLKLMDHATLPDSYLSSNETGSP